MMGMSYRRDDLNSGHALDRLLGLVGRVSIFLAPLTALVLTTVLMVYHGKSVLYALWLALVTCVPVFVLVGVHLLGAMVHRVADPRTPTGIAVFIAFQGLGYGALFLLALPWYFVLIPGYLLGRLIANRVRLRRGRRAALAGSSTGGA